MSTVHVVKIAVMITDHQYNIKIHTPLKNTSVLLHVVLCRFPLLKIIPRQISQSRYVVFCSYPVATSYSMSYLSTTSNLSDWLFFQFSCRRSFRFNPTHAPPPANVVQYGSHRRSYKINKSPLKSQHVLKVSVLVLCPLALVSVSASSIYANRNFADRTSRSPRGRSMLKWQIIS